MKLFSSLVRLLLFSLTSGVAPGSLFDDKSPAGCGEKSNEEKSNITGKWVVREQAGIKFPNDKNWPSLHG